MKNDDLNKTLCYKRISDECYNLANETYRLCELSKLDNDDPDLEKISLMFDTIRKQVKKLIGTKYTISDDERKRRSENMKTIRYKKTE